MRLSIIVHQQMCNLHFSRSFKIWRNWCNQRSIFYLVTLCITSKYLIIFDIIICNKHKELQVNRKNCHFVTLMFNNCNWCNLKQSWLIDLFIICWKLLFLCKSWLILSALILLLFNCLNLIYTLLLRSYSDISVLLTLVNLKIFLLRYLAQILLKSICFVNTCWLENLLAQISCSDFAQILLRYLAQILLNVEIVSRSFNQRSSELICMYCSLEIAITRH